jgi:hypothetical protein
MQEQLPSQFPEFWEAQNSLAHRVDKAMQELRIADALEMIMDRLRAVRSF